MSGGTKWREPKSMPDWTDIAGLLRAIETLHCVTVMVTLTPGIFEGPSMYTTIAAFHAAKVGEASVLGEPCLVLCGEWPCPDHKDYCACLMSALYTLDSKLSSKLWEQIKLPFTAE
jgi:hypothetical protein